MQDLTKVLTPPKGDVLAQRADSTTAERDRIRKEVRRNWRQIIKTITKPAKRKVNGETSYICPLCGHGKNGDGLTVNPESKDGNGLKCFGCGFSGDIIDLFKQAAILDYNEALSVLAEEIGEKLPGASDPATPPKNDLAERHRNDETDTRQGLTPLQAKTPENGAQSATEPPADFSAYYEACSCGKLNAEAHPEAISYLSARGISTETATAFNIGYDPQADPANSPGLSGKPKYYPEPRVIIPCSNSFYIARAIDPAAEYKAPNPKHTTTKLFNADALYTGADVVFIVEGVFDALSAAECGYHAIALNGKGNGKLLLDQLEQKSTDASFVIIPDNDDGKTGENTIKQAQDLARSLRDRGYNVKTKNLPKYHDLNDALKADKGELSGKLKKCKAAVIEQKADDITKFFKEIQTERYKPIKTGLQFFDNLLGGGITRQDIMLLLAAPSTGKTTLSQQIAEAAAETGQPVIYLNFEMSRAQMYAKAISAKLCSKGIKKTAKEILQGYKWTDEDRQIIAEVIDEYRQNNLPYIQYNPAGVSPKLPDLYNYLYSIGEKYKADGEPAPFVFVDYLHLITNGDADQITVIKDTMQALSDYAMDYNSFVLAISATNRESNKGGQITLNSGRDSSAIEYSADYVLTLNYSDVDSGKVSPTDNVEMSKLKRGDEQGRRRMILRTEKNRLDETGRAAQLLYDAPHNCFYGTSSEFIPAGSTPFDDAEQITIRL